MPSVYSTLSSATVEKFGAGQKTPVDNVVGHISLVYELVYPVSYMIVYEQGFLNKLMDFESELPETNRQFEQIREKMNAYIKSECAKVRM